MDAYKGHEIPVSETKDFTTHSKSSHRPPLLGEPVALVPASPTGHPAGSKSFGFSEI